jgi:WD40 repeat protein
MGPFRPLVVVVACTYLLAPIVRGAPASSETEVGSPAGIELDHSGLVHDSPVSSLVFSPDGKTLISAGNYGPIIVWDIANRRSKAILSGSARAFSISPDGKRLVGAGIDSANVRIWGVVSTREVVAIKVPGAKEVSSALISSDGRTLFTLDWDPAQENRFHIRHWDLATSRQERAWSIPKEMYPVSVLPDGKTVLATLQDGTIRKYDVDSRREQTLGRQKAWGWLALSRDARLLASWKRTPNAPISIWEVVSGQEIAVLKGHQRAAATLAWSRDGRFVASGDQRTSLQEPFGAQSVRLWNVATGKQLAWFGNLKADVTALEFAPNGTVLAGGLGDGTIWIWDISRHYGPTLELERDELESRWTDLAVRSAGKAHRAVGDLVSAARISVPFLAERLRPAVNPDPERIEQLVANLGSDSYAIRQAAAKELEKGDAQVIMLLQEALKSSVSLEASLRLKKILNTITDSPGSETLRTIRAITVLERIGSPNARAILRRLASGAAVARETEEANASMQRLTQSCK